MAKPRDKLYWARWAPPPNFYLTYLGVEYDRGQLVPLADDGRAKNNEKLLRLGYIVEWDQRTPRADCGICGASFISEAYLNGHGERRHSGQRGGLDLRPIPNSEVYEDVTGDAEEQRMLRETPLYLDKTVASQRG